MIKNITKYSTLAVPYSILISIFYLLGYWNAFDIDFYSYISVQEIAIRSIQPFIYVGIVSFFGFFTNTESTDKKNKINIVDLLLFIISILFCFLVIFVFDTYRFLAYSVILIIVIILYFRITNNKLLDNKLIFYLIIFLSVLSYFNGRTESEKIIKGTEYKTISFKNINNDSKITNEEYRYIGKISDFLFLYIHAKQSTLIINYHDATPLVINKVIKISNDNQNATSNPTFPTITSP